MGQLPQSPLPVKYFWRSMIANMDAWVRNGTLPPASSYPKISNGTLVPLGKLAFPVIPRVTRPREANAAYRLDYGPKVAQGILQTQPPKVAAAFPVLVPQVNEDGNELDGVRLPELTVPLATYTGWSLRDPSIGAPDQRCAFVGSYVAFARTAEERKKLSDPRKSIAERYAGREDYLARFTQALDELVAARWILPEDRAAMLQLGEREWVEATK
jgi:hypothetical protein